MSVTMSSNKYYMVRAFYDWIVDNQKSPYVVVLADNPGTQVPPAYVQGGQIVLNISPDAVIEFNMTHHRISFEATFSGEPFTIAFPMHAVLAIYARETGQGMVFAEDEDLFMQVAAPDLSAVSSEEQDAEPPPPPPKGPPHLKVVK